MLYTPYVWPCVIAGILLAGIGIYAARYQDVPAAGPFRMVMWGGAGWALAYSLAISTAAVDYRVWLGNCVVLFALGTMTAGLVMAVEYTGRGYWLTRRRLAVLLGAAALIAVLAFSSPYHTLFRYNFRVDLSHGFAGLLFSIGPGYVLYVGYMLLANLTSIALLLWSAYRGNQAWGNALLIAPGIFFPLVAGLVFAVGLSPVQGFDFSSIALVLSGVFFLAALARGHFLEVTHIARDLVMDTVEDLVIVLDARGHVADLNPAARQALGFAGRRFAGMGAAVLPAPWAELLERDPGRAVGQHEFAVDVDGEGRVYDLALMPIRDSRSRPVGRLCLLHDVTARTRAEAELRESEEKFRRMAETSAACMFIYDGQRFLLANPAFVRLLGFSEAELAGIDPIEVIHPDQRKQVQERAMARLSGEALQQGFEVRLLTRSGEERWVELSVALITYGGKTAALGTALDITERRRVEEGLRANRDLYLRIIEDQTDPLCRWLPDTTITFVNQAYCDYFGRPREALLGARFKSYLPAETQAIIQAAVDTLLRHEAETVSREEINLGPTGEQRWMVWAYHPISNADGAVVEFQSVGRDITDRKRVEQALQRVNDDLAAQLEKVQSLQAQLFEQAVRDVLTGLFNRRYMIETLEREIAAAARNRHPISLIMLDLDSFKKLNDTFGHKAGDLVLHSVGRILREHTRKMDVACRYGGEEFVVIMPGAPLAVACQRAEQLRLAVVSSSIEYSPGVLRTTISAGVAVFPDHGRDGEAVLHAADLAMYAAKAAGRNCVRFAEAERVV